MSRLPAAAGMTLGKGCRSSETGALWSFDPSPTPHAFDSDGLDDLDSYYELPDHSCQLELSLPSSKPGSPRRQKSAALALHPPHPIPAFKPSSAVLSSQESVLDSVVGALSLTSADRMNDDVLVYRGYDSSADPAASSDRGSRVGDSQLMDDDLVQVTIVDLDFCKRNQSIFERLAQVCGELVPSMVLDHSELSKHTRLLNPENLEFWFELSGVFRELGEVIERMNLRGQFQSELTLSSAATPLCSGSVTPATPKTPTKTDHLRMPAIQYPFDPSVVGESDEMKDESDGILDLAALADERPLHYACDSTRESRLTLADFDRWESLCGSLAELMIVHMESEIPNCDSCGKPNWFGLCDYSEKLCDLATNVISMAQWNDGHSRALTLFFGTVACRAWKQQQSVDEEVMQAPIVSETAVRTKSSDGSESSTPSPATVIGSDSLVGNCTECARHLRDSQMAMAM